LFALRDDTGAILWSAGNAVNTTSPAVVAGVVYVGAAGDHAIEAHNANDGSMQWTATLGGAIVSSPAVVGGVLYVGSDDSKLYGLDATGKTNCSGTPKVCVPLWTETTGGPVRSSPTVVDGFVYVGSDDSKLHAYGFPPISFGKSVLAGTASTKPSVARLGPDGRLYVAQYNGLIKAYTIARTGANAYNVTNTETINLVQQIPNHNDDGSLNTSVNTRLITGLFVGGSSASPVIYVASSDPRVGGGVNGTITNLDTNSGVISRLTHNGTGGWQRLDLVRGLPRSEENHATNTLVLVVPTSNPAQIHTVDDLTKPGVKIVIGDPSVPVGAYTRTVLSNLGLSAAVLKNVVSQEVDVRSVLAKVALGEADAGFVYATDARTVATKV